MWYILMAILNFIVRDQRCTRVAILVMMMENVGTDTHIAYIVLSENSKQTEA